MHRWRPWILCKGKVPRISLHLLYKYLGTSDETDSMIKKLLKKGTDRSYSDMIFESFKAMFLEVNGEQIFLVSGRTPQSQGQAVICLILHIVLLKHKPTVGLT